MVDAGIGGLRQGKLCHGDFVIIKIAHVNYVGMVTVHDPHTCIAIFHNGGSDPYAAVEDDGTVHYHPTEDRLIRRATPEEAKTWMKQAVAKRMLM